MYGAQAVLSSAEQVRSAEPSGQRCVIYFKAFML
jgi:hypothetical protein